MPPRVHDASLGLHISGSRMGGFVAKDGGCRRKWAFEYIGGVVPPSSIGQAEGTGLHWIGENYLRDGTPPSACPLPPAANDDVERLRVYGKGTTLTGADIERIHERMKSVFTGGVRHLPKPAPARDVSGTLLVEHPAQMDLACGGTFTGTMDALDLNPEPDAKGRGGPLWPEVIDHKKTKSLRYAKSTADLVVHPQPVGYAALVLKLVPKALGVRGRWIYYRSIGKPWAEKVQWVLTREQIMRGVRSINKVSAEMWDLWKRQVDPMDVTPDGYDKGTCSKFGKDGCFFKPMCFGKGDRPMTKSSGAGNGSKLFNALANKGAGLGAASGAAAAIMAAAKAQAVEDGRAPAAANDTPEAPAEDDDGSSLFAGADDVKVNPPARGAKPAAPAEDAAALMAAAMKQKKAKVVVEPKAEPVAEPKAEPEIERPDPRDLLQEMLINPHAKKPKAAAEPSSEDNDPNGAGIVLGTAPLQGASGMFAPASALSGSLALVQLVGSVEIATGGRLLPEMVVSRARELLAEIKRGG